ncbi:MAG TPA: NAD-dependent epimerase/dehydratase family protein, partial [Chthoniobacterales bacterium]|nr:NAD-dependent epimerase/dehydratase family protein [Chthoniobacterales bacterium]
GVMLALATAAKRAFGLIGAEPPVDPNCVDAIVGNYSWYDSSKAVAELGYRIPPPEESLREAVLHARRRLAGTYQLNLKTAGAAYPAPNDNDPLLITGVPGWLGSRMLDIMINGDRFGNRQPPRRIRILAHPSAKGLLELPAQIEIVYGDINDKAALKSALEGVTVVYHLAGAIWPPKVETLYRVNARGTKTLVEACVESGVRRVLFMSTDSTCGHGTATKRVFDENTEADPYRDYGKSKREAEQHLLRATAEGHLDATILRGFWFFGPYAPARQLGFIRMFSWPRQIVFGNGKNLRSISHVDNVVDAFFRAEKNPATYGNWFWVGDAEGGRTVDAIYQTVAEAVNRPYRPFYVPVCMCRIFNLLDLMLSKLGRIQPTVYSAGKFHYDIAGTSEAAARVFGYQPRATLADGVRDMQAMMSSQ